jgi:hypothetical protein
MSGTIIADARAYPRVFQMNGAIPKDRIAAWIEDRQVLVPEALVSLWLELGGGELFEGETILDPTNEDENVDETNAWFRGRGLPAGLLVFHRGVSVSAIDQQTGEIVVLDGLTMKERARFDTLDRWYVVELRTEFAERYGLSPLEEKS